MTKGSLGQVREFAFYHSFERPTRHEVTKGSIGDVKNLRFTTVLSVRHARSDERVVKSTGAIPAPQTEKEYILTLLTLFQTILISNLFSAVFSLVFSPVFQTAITSAELSAVFDRQSLKTAITSVELWADV